MNPFAQKIKKVDFKPEQQTCGPCHYFWFKGLTRWCFHPQRDCEIEDFGLLCYEFSEATRVDNFRVERVDR